MPKKGIKSTASKAKMDKFDLDDFDNDENEDMFGAGDGTFLPSSKAIDQETSVRPMPTTSKKRGVDEDDYDGGNFNNEMQRMLEGFGADISKTLNHKKKRVEQFTHNSLKNTTKKVEELWNTQHQARMKLQEEFGKQVNAVYQQWEADIEKAKEQEEKFNSLFKQQQKLIQQGRIVQNQRLKTLRELSDQFMKGMEELDRSRHGQQTSLQTDLKKEMAMLQKKILMDTQQQEMANVRKSLHSMLF